MTLEVAQAIAWVDGARAGLAQARGRIDAVNVFPVADGDTGTNAWLTLEGGAPLREMPVAGTLLAGRWTHRAL